MSRTGDVTPEQAWQALVDDPRAVLVDVRTRPEHAFVGVPDLTGVGRRAVLLEWNRYPQGHNEGFVEELAGALEGSPKDAPVLFLCRSGVRSVAAADAARDAGWERTYNVVEGFEGDLDEHGHRGGSGWRARGLPWRQS